MQLATHLIPQQAVTLSGHAERLGYSAVVLGEGGTSDGPSLLGMIAERTQRVAIVSGVLQIPARTPGMAALTAATLNRSSGGRFRLGLGVSNPDVAEGWYGESSARPLERTREYVDVVRRALRGETVRHHGEFYRLPAGERAAVPLRIPADDPPPPIYLAAVSSANVALAGEIADGWIGTFTPPDGVATAAREIATRRPAGGFEIVPSLPTVFADDVASGIDRLRAHYAHFLSMGDPAHNVFVRAARRLGFADEVAGFLDAARRTGPERAAAHVPAGLVDRTALVGPVERVADRMAEFADAGATTLTVMLSPARTDTDGVLRILRLAVEAFQRSGSA